MYGAAELLPSPGRFVNFPGQHSRCGTSRFSWHMDNDCNEWSVHRVTSFFYEGWDKSIPTKYLYGLVSTEECLSGLNALLFFWSFLLGIGML